jgi:N-acetylmuramoyl-L-alanine amidase-like protein
VGEQEAIIRRLVVALLAPAAFMPAHVDLAHARTAAVRIALERTDGSRLPQAVRSPWTFQLVGVRSRGDGALELRARRIDGRWTRWVGASQEAPTWTGAATTVQLRRSGPGAVGRIRVSFISSPPVETVTESPTLARPDRPAIITRAGWKADESIRRDDPEIAPALKMAYVHHTATASRYSCRDSARIVRGIYAYHVKTNGWDDIGYNFLVDRCGQVFEGRWGGIATPVVGAHARGFNTGSVGISVIGDFTSSPPTLSARRALRNLIAWRLDVAHVDPTKRTVMVTSGNERFPPGARVRLRTVSGHRDTGATSCPGAALYGLLRRIAEGARRTGLPKIYSPQVERDFRRISPGSVRPVHFKARLSHVADWTLTVRGPTGIVATRKGRGDRVEWLWKGAAALLPSGSYRWTLASPGARSVSWPIGDLGPWAVAGVPLTVDGSTITGGDVGSLQAKDGDTLQVDGTPSSFWTTNRVELTNRQWHAAGHVGGSFTMSTGGHQATIEIWDFAAGTWVLAGHCNVVANRSCLVLRPNTGGTFGQWSGGSAAIRVRVSYPQPMAVESSRAVIRE